MVHFLRSIFDAAYHVTGLLFSWMSPSTWITWVPSSMMHLAQAETKLLNKFIKLAFDTKYVYLPSKQHRLWTMTVNKDHKNMPLVMVHGMGGGIGLWSRNIDELANNRPLYAFDLLGFGRSSRPTFSYTPEQAEDEFVESLEEWRKQMKLDKFVLLGHSLGAYVSSSYALKYPERVKHLVLADPWGFPDKPPDSANRIPTWIRVIGAVISPFNPLAALRVAGPWGPVLVKKFRPDLQRKFGESEEDDTIFDYIYHCNAQTPSGESAFKTMNTSFGWAKRPMMHRVGEIKDDLPVTFIYGSRSWVDSNTGFHAKYLRHESYVDVQVVRGAGHHVYADRPEPFNFLVQRICDAADKDDVPPIRTSRTSINLTKEQSSPDITLDAVNSQL
ncbi:(Lyso)-N-acylphosphatidylethanolamine lipase-like isoform X1 [Mytilus galloprovincialis]|uniref:(Lyso)-N-acylphosphatidylethanolamine lipase-like isoform X1 n=2 Tax=Mytilus galloprovincialis TaxID=29158 RepID=UPI003F7CA016